MSNEILGGVTNRKNEAEYVDVRAVGDLAVIRALRESSKVREDSFKDDSGILMVRADRVADVRAALKQHQFDWLAGAGDGEMVLRS